MPAISAPRHAIATTTRVPAVSWSLHTCSVLWTLTRHPIMNRRNSLRNPELPDLQMLSISCSSTGSRSADERVDAACSGNMATTTTGPATTKSCLSRHQPSKKNNVCTNINKRTVTFSPKASVTIIPSFADMTERERAAIWQSAQERKEDEADIVQSVRILRKANTSDKRQQLPPDITSRGIEHLIRPNSCSQLGRRRKDMINAVLDLQEEVWDQGGYLADPEDLRVVCTSFTQHDAEVAIKLAAGDEAYVRRQRRMEGHDSLTSRCFLAISKKIPGNK